MVANHERVLIEAIRAIVTITVIVILDYFLPLSTILNKVEIDIYFEHESKLSEQSLPPQWCFKIDCNQSLSLSSIIMITRPKPAYGWQGLAGSWGQVTDEVSTFLVFLALTSRLRRSARI